MAYTAGNLLNETGMPPGWSQYLYHTLDAGDVVEDAGYFNNLDDNLKLAKGDRIACVTWTTAILTGIVTEVKTFIVTNVIDNDAASSAGAVNIAEYTGGGAVSSDG